MLPSQAASLERRVASPELPPAYRSTLQPHPQIPLAALKLLCPNQPARTSLGHLRLSDPASTKSLRLQDPPLPGTQSHETLPLPMNTTTPGQFGPTPQGAPGLNPVSANPTPPPLQWSQVQTQLTQDFKQADSTSLSWEIKGLKSIFEQTRGEVRFLVHLPLM